MKFAIFVVAAATLVAPVFGVACVKSKRTQPVSVYGQCGGANYAGSTVCASGSTCVVSSQWYAQCVPGSAPASSSVATTSTVAVAKTSTVVSSSSTTVPVAKTSTTIVSSSSSIIIKTTASITATSTKASATSTTPKATATSVAGYTPVSGIYPFGHVASSIATTYGGNWPGGMCSLDAPGAVVNGVALGKQQWFGAAGCGACVNITGVSGSVIAMVNDQCPECVNDHLDLSTSYAASVDKDWATKGIFDITWDFVPCPVAGKLQFKNKSGSSAYYFALQVRNSVLPIDTLEVSTNSGKTWTNVQRTDYNFFTSTSGFGTVVDVRITATTGAQIIEKGITISSDSIVAGTQQFTA